MAEAQMLVGVPGNVELLRIVENIRIAVGSTDQHRNRLAFLNSFLFAPEFRNDYLRVGTLKISVDGSGMRVPPDKVKAILKAAHKTGWQLFIHLGGGESFDVVTDSLEEAYREFPREDARHVITHARFPSDRNIETLKKYDVLVEPQTGSLIRSRDDAESQVEAGRYGPIPTRTYLDNGIRVMTGTDQKPIGPLNTIWASVNRLRQSGKVIQPEERMTLEEAIRACTIVPAYASFEEDVKGSIEVGKLADLVVLGRDILTVPQEEIRDIPVLMTMIGGKFVYINPNKDPNQKVEYPNFG